MNARLGAEGGLEPLGQRGVEECLPVAVGLRIAEPGGVCHSFCVEAHDLRGARGGADGSVHRRRKPAWVNVIPNR